MTTGDGTYVELHAHTAFSFQDGASQPDELAIAAVELGHTHLAVTDHDNLCGALEFAQAAKAVGLVPITGAELTVADDLERVAHVTVLARTAEGYRNLCRLITLAHRPRGAAAHLAAGGALDPAAVVDSWEVAAHASMDSRAREAEHGRARAGAGAGRAAGGSDLPPGRVPHESTRVRGTAARPAPLVPFAQLCAHAAGLTILTGCASRGLLNADIASGRFERAAQLVRRLQHGAGAEHVYVELQLPQHRGDADRVRSLRRIAELAGAPVVATGNVHGHDNARARLAEVLTAIRLNTTLEACEPERAGNLARALRSPVAMAERFALHPDAVANTRRIAESIEFDLTQDLGYQYPNMVEGSGRSADDEIAAVTVAELERRYANQPNLLLARARLDAELAVIRRHNLSGFFLLHRDVLELAREVALDVRGPGSIRHLNPPGRGRGSSVESIVCYLTGLSHVDPLATGLRMGRFLNDELPSMPDIDLDFPRDIRHGLLRRVVERYGADRCAMVAAHATFRVRSAVRDVGAALGLPQAELTRIAKRTDARNAVWVAEAMGSEHTGPRWDAFRHLTAQVADLPRQIGQHSGGVIVCTTPLDEIVPIQPAAMHGRQICQWDKDSCADAGFLKIDVLGLGMLSSVEETIETIHLTTGDAVDLSRIDYDDPAVFAEIQDGDTVGTFQIESRAQIGSLKRTKPESMHDLAIQVALIRPGPIIGKSVNPYVQLRERKRVDPTIEPTYDHPLLEPVLRDTYGAIIFQDQVIEVAMAVAGFTAGEADGLRRAMSRKRAAGSVEAYRERFMAGAARRGCDAATATTIFDRVIGFCSYGFPRAHAVAFAVLAYQSAWLRHHYPAHFTCSLLNAQPMGFYPPDSLLRDAGRHGVGSRGVDINASDALCTVELGEDVAGNESTRRHTAIRVGLGYVKGVGYDGGLQVQREREERGPYVSIEDLARRAPVTSAQLEQLVMSGACDSLGPPRRELLWQLGMVARPYAGQEALDLDVPNAPGLSQLSLWDETVLDFRTQGLSTRAHPVELLRPLLAQPTTQLGELVAIRHNAVVDLVGAVVARQKPGTAKGVVFLLLEDGTGTANVIVNPDLYRRERLTVRGESIIRMSGRVERHGDVINVIARDIRRLPAELRGRAPRKLQAKNFA